MHFLEHRVRLLRDTTSIKPRVHPNGFVQLDLSDEERMHVWHPALPYRQKTFHPIHDHVFSFKSVVHSGRLINVRYDLHTSRLGKYRMWEAVCIEGEESKLVIKGWQPNLLSVTVARAEVLGPGDCYTLEAGEFHESMANEPTATVMIKQWRVRGSTEESPRPCVLMPVGVEPDNDFRRASVDTDVLWDLILEAMP